MPRSRELLAALLKYPPGSENRLTELFATVVATHGGMARLMFERAGITLPKDEVRFEVRTQHRVAPGCIPDMLVSAFVDGHLRAQLWSEHKTGSGFRDLQLPDYLDALRSKPFEGALIAIVVERDAEQEGSDWKLITWQEIAELANRAGSQVGVQDWRNAALDPAAPVRQRLLHEFIWYLEEEGFAVVDALNNDNLFAFRKAAETMAALETLLERTGEHMQNAFEPTEPGYYGDGSVYFHLFKLPPASWPKAIRDAGWRVDLELVASADDGWWEEATGEPALGAGLTLDEGLYETLASDSEWLAHLRDAGLGLMAYQDYVRVYRTLPLADLIAAGETLDEQARALAAWARESFALALEHGPGEGFEVPAKMSGRRRARTGDADDYLSQPVTEADIRHGRIRVPQDGSKSLFPGESAAEMPIVLRGSELTAGWNPRFGRHGAGGEKSGQLRVGREALEGVIDAGERLVLTRADDVVHIE